MRSVFVGLAGSGKTSLAQFFANRDGMKIISTDKRFAEYCQDVNHPVVKAHMHAFTLEHSEIFDTALLSSTAKMIEAYGDKSFRDFEERAIAYMFEQGEMDNAIPDLGGAAFVRPGTREMLLKNGFVPVYIDAPREFIAANLLKDYETSKQTGQTMRGNYFACGQKAEEQNRSVPDALSAFSEEHRAARKEFYELAPVHVQVALDDSIEAVAKKVEQALESYGQKFSYSQSSNFNRPTLG